MKKLILLFFPLVASAQWHDTQRDIVVASIEYGVDCSQFDCVLGFDFVDNDADPTPINPHGTDTAKILNDLTPVKVMPFRALTDQGIGTDQWLADAVNQAKDDGADFIMGIVLVSQQWGIGCYDQPGCMPLFCQAIEDSGLLYIGVTGNEGVDLTQTIRYPAACPADNMIIVAGSDRTDTVFTSFPGDIAAPGEDIPLASGELGSGASYAAPQVAAIAAIELRTNPDLTAAELKAEVLKHQRNGILNAFYPEKIFEVPPPPMGTPVLEIVATINISDINQRNPIQSKQAAPERGYVFEVPAGSAPRVLTLENWPSGASSPTMVRGSTVLSEGVDYTVSVVHDGVTARLYVNGLLDGELVTPPPRENSAPVRVCRYRWSSSYDVSFNGICVVQ